MTSSATSASALRALSASAPEVRVPLVSLGDTRTSRSIREARSMPEGFKNETVLETPTALTPRTELSDKSNDQGKLSSAGSSLLTTTDVGVAGSIENLKYPSQTTETAFINVPASPSGTSQTLAPNKPNTLIGVLPSAGLHSIEYVLVHEERPRPVMKQKGESQTFQYGMDAMPGPSQGSQVPTRNLKESTPVIRRPATYVLKPEICIKEGLRSASTVGICAAPFEYIVPMPEDRQLGTPMEPHVPAYLQVSPRDDVNQDDEDEISWEDPFAPISENILGACLVSPCPYMRPHRRWFAYICFIFCFFVCTFGLVIFVFVEDKWRIKRCPTSES